ncbi:His Kinase A domain containing protein [Serendipita sp. 399]|nr:His Kinase A domain containing protein [Serendipita sp. 399]
MSSDSFTEQIPLARRNNSHSDVIPDSDAGDVRAFTDALHDELELIDIYDLDLVTKLAESSSASFFTTYAEGDWASNSIPPIPIELQELIDNEISGTTIGLSKPKKDSPPPILESVEEAYRSYLEESHSQFSPSTSISLTPLSEAIHNVFERDFHEANLASSSLHPDSPQETLSTDATQRRTTTKGSAKSSDNAAISLVDTDFTHVTLPDAKPVMVPRGESMCSHTILVDVPDEPMVVQDALKDWRFRNNVSFGLIPEHLYSNVGDQPTVTGAWSIRFYAGHPLRTSDGFHIGTVCILDSKPQSEFTQRDKNQLKELAGMVMHELEAHAQQREEVFRESLHISVETFNQAINTGSYTGQQALSIMVNSIQSMLAIEGVLCLDVRPCKASLAKTEQNPLGRSVSVPILAASEHAMTHVKDVMVESETLLKIFKDRNGEVVHGHGESLPEFTSMLPPGVTAGATLINRGSDEPFMVIIAYSSKECPPFVSTIAVMAYLRAMGTIVCTVQEKQTLSLADKAKIDFIANISHELRTPLHGVIASCDLLSETNLTDAQESLLETAKACASSLAETINHVLDFTKANAMRSEALREYVDLAQLVEETMTSCWLGRTVQPHNDGIGEIYNAGSLSLRRKSESPDFVEPLIDIEPVENWSVMIDKSGLRRILLNLIGNSMKFTRGGYVKVGLHRGVSTDPERMAVEIVVEDTGCGISETFVRDKLFHPFSQEAPLAQGIGLGLAIVRSILKSPGIEGTIDVHTKVDVGTRMILRLQPPIANDSRSWTRSPYSQLQPKLLPSFAMCGFYKEHRGSAMLASGIRRGLQHWYETVVEVDVSKAELLIVDGDSADVSKLDELGTNHPMILLLCSSPVDSMVFKAIQDYSGDRNDCAIVVKPLGPHALSKALSTLLGYLNTTRPALSQYTLPNSSTVSQISGPTATQEHPNHQPTAIRPQSITSINHLRILVVEDNPVNRRVMTTYLKKRGCFFVAANNGIEGVERFRESKVSPFHVCLMDLQMPHKDGFEATREIRQLEAEWNTPRRNGIPPTKVFAITGLATPEDRVKATETGFDGYLVKPVTFAAIELLLQDVVDSLP